MIGILGVGRQGHDPVGGLFGRTVNPQTALLATIGIHGRTLGLQRILDRVADGHLDPHGLACGEGEIPLVTAAGRQVAHHARRTIERHARALAQQKRQLDFAPGIVAVEIGHVIFAQRLLVAHGQISRFGQPGVAGTAITVERHVMGILGERTRQLGLAGAAGDDNLVRRQIAAREIELHPTNRIVDGPGAGIARVEHLYIITRIAEPLPVAQQLGLVLSHPRLQRQILQLIVGFGLLPGTRNGQQQGGHGGQTQTDITHHRIFSGCCHSTLSTLKKTATGLSLGMK